MPQQTAPPPLASVAPPAPAGSSVATAPTLHSGNAVDDRHVYRLDFVLTTSEGGAAPTSTSFTLNLAEHDKGEVHVGKNVVISPLPAGSTTSGPPPRQDVGLKVAAGFRMMGGGDDLLIEVSTEMSVFDPPTTIRKMVSKGSALAAPGKSAVVTTLDDDKKHYQLAVTTVKLR